MVSVRVERTIAADPTSTALLLAAPSALDMVPGLRRLGTVDGLVRAEASFPTMTTVVLVRAEPPKRLPTSFVTHFAVTSPAADHGQLPDVDGTLKLEYAGVPGSEVSTRAVLELAPAANAPADSSATPVDLEALAREFLANLARAAEQRSHAA